MLVKTLCLHLDLNNQRGRNAYPQFLNFSPIFLIFSSPFSHRKKESDNGGNGGGGAASYPSGNNLIAPPNKKQERL